MIDAQGGRLKYVEESGRFASFVLVAACTSIGPATVSRDRADYVNALGTSWGAGDPAQYH
jgi:hypothetical protein